MLCARRLHRSGQDGQKQQTLSSDLEAILAQTENSRRLQQDVSRSASVLLQLVSVLWKSGSLQVVSQQLAEAVVSLTG